MGPDSLYFMLILLSSVAICSGNNPEEIPVSPIIFWSEVYSLTIFSTISGATQYSLAVTILVKSGDSSEDIFIEL